MPKRMIKVIGKDAYEQLQAGIAITNKMIADGYLRVDEDFNLHVTEKYIDEVRANMRAQSQNLQMKGISTSSISVSSERNSVIMNFSIHNKMNAMSIENGGGGGVAGGITDVEWYWWGFKLYLDDEIVDAILYIGEDAEAIVPLLMCCFPKKAFAIAVASGIILLGLNRLERANENNTGVIIHFAWRPPTINAPIPFKIESQ